MFNLFLAVSPEIINTTGDLVLSLALSSTVSFFFLVLILISAEKGVSLVIPVSEFGIYVSILVFLFLVFIISYVKIYGYEGKIINGVCTTAQLSAFLFWAKKTRMGRLYALAPFLGCYCINLFYLFGGETPQFAFIIGIVFIFSFLFFVPPEVSVVLVTLLHGVHPQFAAWALHFTFFCGCYFALDCLTGQDRTRPALVNWSQFVILACIQDYLFPGMDSLTGAHLSLLFGGACIVFVWLHKEEILKIYIGMGLLCVSGSMTSYLLANDKTVFVYKVPVGLFVFLFVVVFSVLLFKFVGHIFPEAPREHLLLAPLLAILCGFPDLRPFQNWISGFGLLMVLLRIVLMFEESIKRRDYGLLKSRRRLLRLKVGSLRILLLLVHF